LIGIVPQNIHYNKQDTSFITNITNGLLWGLLYLTFLLSLGALVIRRTCVLKKRDISFYLVHIGIWLILFFAVLNSFQSKRYVMTVNLNQTEWRVYDDEDNLIKLPIAIQLDAIAIKDNVYKNLQSEIFSSKITIYTKEGLEQSSWIKVNYPVRLNNWTIYIKNVNFFDTNNKSIFILAFNPYWNQILAGILVLIIGLVVLFYQKCFKIKK